MTTLESNTSMTDMYFFGQGGSPLEMPLRTTKGA